MKNRMMRIPIVMLWSSAAMLALKLVKIHLIRNGLFDSSMVNLFAQLKVISAVTILSALIYEAKRFMDFMFFGDDDTKMDR